MSALKDELAKHEAARLRLDDIERQAERLRLRLIDAVAMARNKAHVALARARLAVPR